MRTSLASAVALGLLVIVGVACSGGLGTVEGESGTPREQAEVTASTGLSVKASIASATLGDECGGAGGFAPSEGDCAGDAKGCGFTCQQSNVQLAFVSGAGERGARVEIVSVKLVDADSRSEVDSLTASKPQAWSGNGYATWDEIVPPSKELKVSYALSAPRWSTIGSDGRNMYSAKYRLHVALRIDGVAVILESAILTREPAVAT